MSTVTGIVGVGVAIPVTVVTFGPSNLLAIMKRANSHRDRGGRRRYPCSCRHFGTLESSCNYEKYQPFTGIVGVGVAFPVTVVTLGPSNLSCNYEKHEQSQGSWGVGVAIPVTVVTLGPSNLLAIMKSINSHRDRGGRRRHPCNCRHFWTLESCCNYEKY